MVAGDHERLDPGASGGGDGGGDVIADGVAEADERPRLPRGVGAARGKEEQPAAASRFAGDEARPAIVIAGAGQGGNHLRRPQHKLAPAVVVAVAHGAVRAAVGRSGSGLHLPRVEVERDPALRRGRPRWRP